MTDGSAPVRTTVDRKSGLILLRRDGGEVFAMDHDEARRVFGDLALILMATATDERSGRAARE